jgi:hypothetical protein
VKADTWRGRTTEKWRLSRVCDFCKAEPFGDCHDGRVNAVGACSRGYDRAGVEQDHGRPNSARKISPERSPKFGSSLSKLSTHGGGHGSPH